MPRPDRHSRTARRPAFFCPDDSPAAVSPWPHTINPQKRGLAGKRSVGFQPTSNLLHRIPVGAGSLPGTERWLPANEWKTSFRQAHHGALASRSDGTRAGRNPSLFPDPPESRFSTHQQPAVDRCRGRQRAVAEVVFREFFECFAGFEDVRFPLFIKDVEVPPGVDR